MRIFKKIKEEYDRDPAGYQLTAIVVAAGLVLAGVIVVVFLVVVGVI